MRPAVFLDRDDTIIANRRVTAATAHPGDLFDPALVELLPGAAEGLGRLSAAGFALVVLSNQGGVAQGIGSLRQVEAVNDRLRELLGASGVRLDAVYYSPARPPPKGVVPRFATPHPWRKPAPGMALAAAGEMGLDLDRSWVIGDAPRDVEAGIAAGIAAERCLLLAPHGPFRDIDHAAQRILGDS